MCEGEFEVFFGDQALVKVGLPSGKDFGLIFGQAGLGQALDEGMGVEGGGLSLYGAQNSAWGGASGCGAFIVSPRLSARLTSGQAADKD